MRDHRTVTFNSSSPPRTVEVQLISPVFVLRMELPAYWTCWTRRELNYKPKMLMRKAIPTAPSLLFYSTNRSRAGGHNIFLSIREAEDREARSEKKESGVNESSKIHFEPSTNQIQDRRTEAIPLSQSERPNE
jgi:hypothetical protein